MDDRKLQFFVASLILSLATGCRDSTSNEMQPASKAEAGRKDVSDISVGISSTSPLEVAKATLKETVRGDREGEALAQFFGTHAVEGRLKPGNNVSLNSPEDMARVAKREAFILLASTAAERTRSGRMTFSYDPTNRAMYAPPSGAYTNLWSGVALAHETYHASVDQGDKPKRDAAAEEIAFFQEEIDAHTIQFRLLDRYTTDRFSQEVERFTLDHPAPKDFPWAFYYPTGMEDFRDIDRHLPPSQSEQEKNSRIGSYLIAVNFRYADKKGGNQDKILFYRNLRRKMQ